MKKIYYEYFGIPLPIPSTPDPIEQVENSDPMLPILHAIYASDPVTKLPTGDIMCYLSSNTPPEVKEFILKNLQMDISTSALPSVPDGIDDDTAFALTRQPKETLDSYRERVNNFAQMNIEFVQRKVDEFNKQFDKKDDSEGDK